jgi:hypothetical protein
VSVTALAFSKRLGTIREIATTSSRAAIARTPTASAMTARPPTALVVR